MPVSNRFHPKPLPNAVPMPIIAPVTFRVVAGDSGAEGPRVRLITPNDRSACA